MKNLPEMVKIGILASFSTVLMIFIQIPIFPSAPFLKLDIADIPVLIGGFMFGPLQGIIILALRDTLFLLLKGGPFEFAGISMNLIATGTFAIVSSSIYRIYKTKKGAIISLILGTLSMTIIMLPCNMLIYPLVLKWFYLDLPFTETALKNFIIFSILPFNIIKGTINSILIILVYKRISFLLKCDEHFPVNETQRA